MVIWIESYEQKTFINNYFFYFTNFSVRAHSGRESQSVQFKEQETNSTTGATEEGRIESSVQSVSLVCIMSLCARLGLRVCERVCSGSRSPFVCVLRAKLCACFHNLPLRVWA